MEWRGREWSGGEGRGGQGRAGQGARLLRWTFTGMDFIPLNTPVELAASINNQTEIVNGERGHSLVWSVMVKG